MNRLLFAAAGALVGVLAVDVYRRDGAPWWTVVWATRYVVGGAIAGFSAPVRPLENP